MIASPSDVADERQIIREVVGAWNDVHAENRRLVLMPVGWETHSTPTMGERPQAIINKQVLANCDLLIAVFWTRLGSPTGQAASGTVEELEEHLKSGKPAMLYCSDAPVRLDSVDEAQYQALRTFKGDCHKRGLVESYDSLALFKDKLTRQLAQTVIREFSEIPLPKAHDTDSAHIDDSPLIRELLTDDAKALLLTAVSGDGEIMQIRTLDGIEIQAGDKSFVENQSAREVARWRSTIKELLDHHLIEDRGYKEEIFEVTHRGHQVVQEILSLGQTA